jgi:hypothetical protein
LDIGDENRWNLGIMCGLKRNIKHTASDRHAVLTLKKELDLAPRFRIQI